jgi:hypothetical protein
MTKPLPAHITQVSQTTQRFDNVSLSDLTWEPLNEAYYLFVNEDTSFYLDTQASYELRNWNYSEGAKYSFLGYLGDLFLISEPNAPYEK